LYWNACTVSRAETAGEVDDARDVLDARRAGEHRLGAGVGERAEALGGGDADEFALGRAAGEQFVEIAVELEQFHQRRPR
jgi:hypothetical protein